MIICSLLDLFLTRRVKRQGGRSDETGIPNQYNLRPGRLQALFQ
jgi:hypothetical protein